MSISFSPLPLASLLFSAICKASLDNHFAFLHFFFLGMVLITLFCTMSWTCIHSSSGTLSVLIPWIYLSLTCQHRRHKRPGFCLWFMKIPWRRAWLPTPAFLPGESHGQRSLAGYSSWGQKESDMTEGTQQPQHHDILRSHYSYLTLWWWCFSH